MSGRTRRASCGPLVTQRSLPFLKQVANIFARVRLTPCAPVSVKHASDKGFFCQLLVGIRAQSSHWRCALLAVKCRRPARLDSLKAEKLVTTNFRRSRWIEEDVVPSDAFDLLRSMVLNLH